MPDVQRAGTPAALHGVDVFRSYTSVVLCRIGSGTQPPHSGSSHVGINSPFRLTSHWKRRLLDRVRVVALRSKLRYVPSVSVGAVGPRDPSSTAHDRSGAAPRRTSIHTGSRWTSSAALAVPAVVRVVVDQEQLPREAAARQGTCDALGQRLQVRGLAQASAPRSTPLRRLPSPRSLSGVAGVRRWGELVAGVGVFAATAGKAVRGQSMADTTGGASPPPRRRFTIREPPTPSARRPGPSRRRSPRPRRRAAAPPRRSASATARRPT